MRILIGVILVAALGWSAYWWIGARSVENGMRDWLDQRAEAGWVAEYASVETKGFPNRFDTEVADLELADPANAVAWSAPFFQLFRLSYKPNHIVVAWPKTQSLATPNQTITLANDSAQGSFVFKSGTDLELDRSTVEFMNLALDSNAGWQADSAMGIFASRPSTTTAGAIDLVIDAKDIHFANDTLALNGLVPGLIERLKLDAAVAFDAPWDRRAVEDQRPQVTALDLKLMQIEWGQLDLWAAGDLTFDDLGRASGSITIKAKNWKEMLQLAVASGWVPEALQPTLESGLGLLASLSGPATTLDAPLSFKNGAVSFGPIPLGELSPLLLR